jgi:hypothetical protein
MLLAALLAMTLAASAPAWAQQTSGPATANPSVNAAHAGNVCVQQVQNVNTGNVSQSQEAVNENAQIGFIQEAIAEAVAGDDALAEALNLALGVDVAQTQTVDQSITQSQQGISQTNNALQLCHQTLNR